MDDFLFDVNETKSPKNTKVGKNENAFHDIRSNLQKETVTGNRHMSDAHLKKKDSPRGIGNVNPLSPAALAKNKDLHPNKNKPGQGKGGMDVKDLGVVPGDSKGKRNNIDDSGHGLNLNS